MRILVDENIPLITVQELRENGHDVLDIRGTSDEGADDSVVWQIAQAQQRLLITTDRGFGKHRFEDHFGILIVRLRKPNRALIHQRVMDAFTHVPVGSWRSLMVVMRDTLHSIWSPKSSGE